MWPLDCFAPLAMTAEVIQLFCRVALDELSAARALRRKFWLAAFAHKINFLA